ncbi:MAG: MarR family transcriptional regulator [Chloroflexi bacterium]|nr:MarR family transcriptional regulator [Chloroflexota bacterium]
MSVGVGHPGTVGLGGGDGDVRAEDAAALLIELMPRLIRTTIDAMRAAPHADGMTLAQFKVLSRLNERDYRCGELADLLEVGGATLTVTADTLERRGLIERVRGLPDDRRAVVLRLTPDGQAVYQALKAEAVGGIAALLARSDPDERAALVDGLRALQRGLESA